MNRVLLTLSLQLSLTLGICVQAKEQRIEINHPIIKVIDGSPLINMREIIKLESDIQKLTEGDGKGRGSIPYASKSYSLKQLIILKNETKNHHPHSFNEGPEKQFKEACDNALTQFKKFSHAYLRKSRPFKRQMCALIEQWSKQRKKSKSILTEWGKQSEGQEHEQLKLLVNRDLETFEMFLSDLLCFLKDLRFSCKKSWSEFIKTHQNAH
jgi:hypothetical protein